MLCPKSLGGYIAIGAGEGGIFNELDATLPAHLFMVAGREEEVFGFLEANEACCWHLLNNKITIICPSILVESI